MVTNSKVQKPAKKTFGTAHDALKALHHAPHGLKKPHQHGGHMPARKTTSHVIRGK